MEEEPQKAEEAGLGLIVARKNSLIPYLTPSKFLVSRQLEPTQTKKPFAPRLEFPLGQKGFLGAGSVMFWVEKNLAAENRRFFGDESSALTPELRAREESII